MLLVTPSKLELLNDEEEFIPNLLPLIFDNPLKVSSFDLVVAVVDKIPYPKHDLPGISNRIQTSNGSEGMSVLIGSSTEIAPDLWTAADQVDGRETTTSQQPCALSFLLHRSAANSASFKAKKYDEHAVWYDLKLPLANTLFHNGQMSTLYAERWKSRGKTTKKSDIKFSRVRKAFLQQQTLDIGHIFFRSHRHVELNTMLKPIVPPRIVAAALGNIIRKFYTCSGSSPKATIPASKELENAVSDYLKTSQDPTQKMNIWALVTPQEYSISGPQVGSDLQKSIENGSRLHKVLSGGGGWGIKEGLLALDPDIDYNGSEHGTPTDSDLAGAPFCRDIFRPGDLVSFFVSTSLDDLRKNVEEPQKHSAFWIFWPPRTTVFGTLPSNMDAMPTSNSASSQPDLLSIVDAMPTSNSASSQPDLPSNVDDMPNSYLAHSQAGLISNMDAKPETNSASDQPHLASNMDALPNSNFASSHSGLPFDYVLLQNHFGMLSERGMSIKVCKHGLDDSRSYREEKPSPVVRTKLDAPYTLFSAVASQSSFLKIRKPERVRGLSPKPLQTKRWKRLFKS